MCCYVLLDQTLKTLKRLVLIFTFSLSLAKPVPPSSAEDCSNSTPTDNTRCGTGSSISSASFYLRVRLLCCFVLLFYLSKMSKVDWRALRARDRSQESAGAQDISLDLHVWSGTRRRRPGPFHILPFFPDFARSGEPKRLRSTQLDLSHPNPLKIHHPHSFPPISPLLSARKTDRHPPSNPSNRPQLVPETVSPCIWALGSHVNSF